MMNAKNRDLENHQAKVRRRLANEDLSKLELEARYHALVASTDSAENR